MALPALESPPSPVVGASARPLLLRADPAGREQRALDVSRKSRTLAGFVDKHGPSCLVLRKHVDATADSGGVDQLLQLDVVDLIVAGVERPFAVE